MSETAATTDPALYWAVGGSALLLLGLGGAMLRRRRLSNGEQAENATAAPVAYRRPATVESAPFAAVAPVATCTPAMARMPVTDLDAMVAAPPSAENPFRTYRKRKARAKFLLGHQARVTRSDVPVQETKSVEPVLPRMETQTVYRFGSERDRQPGFRPQTR